MARNTWRARAATTRRRTSWTIAPSPNRDGAANEELALQQDGVRRDKPGGSLEGDPTAVVSSGGGAALVRRRLSGARHGVRRGGPRLSGSRFGSLAPVPRSPQSVVRPVRAPHPRGGRASPDGRAPLGLLDVSRSAHLVG